MATLASLADGALVKFGSIYGKPIIWRVIGQNHYGDGQTSLHTENIIKLACFDAKEPSNSDSNRVSYGNNNYAVSNMRQWLNSDADGGAWYAAQHSADAPPSNANVWAKCNEYDAFPGFLNGFTTDEKNAILSTTITYGKASVDGGGTAMLTDKVFLLSCTEVGLSGDHVCGTKFSIYSSDAARIAKPTADAVSNSEYKDSSLNTSSSWYYWLRDAYASDSYSVRLVDMSGFMDGSGAYSSFRGVRPALNLPSSISLSNSTDGDGCYTLVFLNAVTFNSNGGIFSSDSTTSKSVQINLDGTVSLSSIVEFPVKSGYVFKGWSTTENGSVVYTPYATPIITEDTTLYAVWEEVELYLVRKNTLVNIANAIRTKSNTSATMTPDEMATAISGLSTKAILTLSTSHGTAPSNISAKYTKPTNPTATGYTFVNWYKDSALTTLFDFDAVAEGGTAYAKWSINAPTVSNPDLEEDGTNYTLGTVTPAGSGQTVYYSADNSTWSTTCPKQSAEGTYTTYWKITAQDCDDLIGSFTTTIKSRIAFAVYSADDTSLNFYKRSSVPTAGSTFNGKTATAVYTGIEETGYNSTTQPWSSYKTAITSVSFVDSGIKPWSTAYWFYGMSNASLTTIGGLDKLDTSKVTQMTSMFEDCTKLTSLDLSGWDTARLTDMPAMFKKCKALTSLDLSSFNTSSVTNMGQMFAWSPALGNIYVSDTWSTANVATSTHMFANCTKLPNFNSSVVDKTNAHYNTGGYLTYKAA